MQLSHTAIDSVGFSTRVMNVLNSLGVSDLAELACLTEQDLYRLPNLGKKSIQEIHFVLDANGLMLGMQMPAEPSSNASMRVRDEKSVDDWIRHFAARRVPFLESASIAGYASADNHLGRLYLEGIGVDRDYRKARVLFIRAARRGCRLGYANLALIYAIGFGVRRSLVKADRLMRRFAMAACQS